MTPGGNDRLQDGVYDYVHMLCCDNAVIIFTNFHRCQLQEKYVTQFYELKEKRVQKELRNGRMGVKNEDTK
jgi:hypothetical protein